MDFDNELIERGGALHVRIEHHLGQWWVVFEVTSADTGATTRRMIRSFATQRAARVAARWMRRGADRYPNVAFPRAGGEPFG